MTVYFSPPEEEIIASLQEIYGITYLQAADQVIMQKRDLAFQHQIRGNLELAKNILCELDEWNDEHQEEFDKQKVHDKPKEIIIP